jgi:phosphoglucosamine mutase
MMERYPQAKENVRVARRQLGDGLLREVERVNAELEGRGRVLVRPSGTEPVIRVLAEAETDEAAAELCASITALVQQELG